jgi:hypothetical protein
MSMNDTTITDTDEFFDDYEDYSPVLTPAEEAYYATLDSVNEFVDAHGVSTEEACAALRVCGFVIELVGWEGERTTGRCLAPWEDDEIGACEGHASEIRGWQAMSGAEQREWEIRHDEDGF